MLVLKCHRNLNEANKFLLGSVIIQLVIIIQYLISFTRLFFEGSENSPTVCPHNSIVLFHNYLCSNYFFRITQCLSAKY